MEHTETTPENQLDGVTDPVATIRIEGQEFELETALAADDKMLRTVLQPHYSSVENAAITREVKDGKLAVTIVKKAQHKGSRLKTPLSQLLNEPDRLNPAILLADDLMRRSVTDIFEPDEGERAAQILEIGRAEIRRTETCFETLTRMPATASPRVPAGF